VAATVKKPASSASVRPPAGPACATACTAADTESFASGSATVSVPLAARPPLASTRVAPVLSPASARSVGPSLLPASVMVRIWTAVPPWPSAAVTV
jgi:hypothetical protein